MARFRPHGASSAPPRRRGRMAAVSMGVGVALIVVFALVFSIAFGTRGVAEHATALHHADEALRSATVVRSQAGMATHLSLLEADFGLDADDAIALATEESRRGLEDLNSSVLGLVAATASNPTLDSATGSFRATVHRILGALEDGDVAAAQEVAAGDLDAGFHVLMSAIVTVRDAQAAEVAAASALMGRIGDIARFLVAFLVPTSAILLYRDLARRQQRQRELEVRLDTEKELGKARDEFVANASHELRTPLTSIFGLAHLLEEDDAVTSSPGAVEMVGLIISETHDLSRMVDDLLTTARLDAGALHYQFENLNVLDEVREVVEPMRRSGAAFAVEVQPALVRSDRLRLRQVVRNLLSNARKYGGPTIRVLGRVEAGWYEVRVEDDGAGIPRELHERLFQRYLHKGDQPLVVGSVGLGLSIVRALAEGMGGAVWYERRTGWTSFVVRVPLATRVEASATPESRAAVGWEPVAAGRMH